MRRVYAFAANDTVYNSTYRHLMCLTFDLTTRRVVAMTNIFYRHTCFPLRATDVVDTTFYVDTVFRKTI